ncbi:hypothetical protein B566_EDAN002034, partial [Ephemera danica]
MDYLPRLIVLDQPQQRHVQDLSCMPRRIAQIDQSSFHADRPRCVEVRLLLKHTNGTFAVGTAACRGSGTKAKVGADGANVRVDDTDGDTHGTDSDCTVAEIVKNEGEFRVPASNAPKIVTRFVLSTPNMCVFPSGVFEPKESKYRGLDSLFLFGDLTLDITDAKHDGRKATVDIIKKWHSYNLNTIIGLRIMNFPLKHLRADDFAYRLTTSGNCLQYASQIENINLDFNDLQDETIIINASIFPSLKYLSFSNNRLKSLPIFQNIPFIDYTFDTSLRELDVSNNLIDSFANIDYIRHIRFLNLSHNYIQTWNKSGALNSNNHAIDIVDLRYNKIKSLNEEMLLSMSKGTIISLVGNPFDCDDCSIPAFQIILQNKSFIHLDDNRKFHETGEEMQYLCTYPQSLYSTPIQKERKILPDSKVFDAFISYSHHDKAWVHDHLLQNLENGDEKYTICLHDRDFFVGTYIMDNIVQSLESCRHVILVLSSNYLSSKWCQWELKLIQHMIFETKSPFLIIVELENMYRKNLPLSLRLLIDTRICLEWNDLQQHQFWGRLRRLL